MNDHEDIKKDFLEGGISGIEAIRLLRGGGMEFGTARMTVSRWGQLAEWQDAT